MDMQIEITAAERALLLWSLISGKVENEQYLKNYPESSVADQVRAEIKLADALYDKIYNATFGLV